MIRRLPLALGNRWRNRKDLWVVVVVVLLLLLHDKGMGNGRRGLMAVVSLSSTVPHAR